MNRSAIMQKSVLYWNRFPPEVDLVFSSNCSEDVLERNWQRLIMTHLEEKSAQGSSDRFLRLRI